MEALRGAAEKFGHFLVCLLVGGAERRGSAFALLAGRRADFVEAVLDVVRRLLRRFGEERTDLAGARFGIAERVVDQSAEGLQHAFEIAAAVFDFAEQSFECIVALHQRGIDLALRTFEFASRLHQRVAMRADGAGERIGPLQRAAGDVAEMRDLRGDVFDRAAERTEMLAELGVRSPTNCRSPAK